jgi:FHS family L-fucose permease-like MFS transporter
VGGAIGTPLMGLIAEETHSTALSYCLPLLGYIVVGIFARYMSGYAQRRISMSDAAA